jgi:hypothetical protein
VLAGSRAFAPILALLAVGFGVAAALFQINASDEPARPSFDGTVAVATNAPDGQVEMIVSEVSDGGAASGSVLRVLVNVNAGEAVPSGLLVAVGLQGDARVDGGRTPQDGLLVAKGDGRPELTAGGLDQPFFASGTAWPPDAGSESGGEIVFGQANDCMVDWCSVVVTVPMSRSMVEAVGGLWTLSTPRLGAEAFDPDFPDLAIRFEPPSDSLALSELERLQSLNDAEGERDNDWYLPKTPAFTFEMSPTRASDSVQQSGTSPVEAFGNVWRGSAPFAVVAIFAKPHLVAKQDRRQFYAGVSVSLAVSLLVWAGDIYLRDRSRRDEVTQAAS